MERMYPKRLLGDHFMPAATSFRIFQHSLDSHIYVHWHDFFELAYVTAGSGTHVLNGITRPISKGMTFLLTPADFHEIIPDPGATIELYNMIFVESFMDTELYKLLFQEQSNLIFTFGDIDSPHIQAEFMRIWEESKQPHIGSKLLIRGAFERILIQLARKVQVNWPNISNSSNSSIPSIPVIHPSIQNSLIYLQHHFREQITLAEIAKKVGLSANYFSEIFRSQTGQTFQNFVQASRLQFAKSLLLTTSLPITEIAFASGFQTFNNFERAFKKKFGCSPRTFQKDNR